MPAPMSSIQHVCLQIEHPVLQKGQEASISIPGSTNGKYPGRARISRSFFSKKARKNAFAVANKLAIETFLSIKRPSPCMNIKSWVASVASLRYTRPGAKMARGTDFSSIVFICTLEVCVLSRYCGLVSQKVSWSSRAGWCSGILSASKL